MNRQLAKIYQPKYVRFALNLWPPFWGAGIKILSISEDFRQVKVRLKLRWWNKNANRTQFGGSMFSMTDPIYALMLMGILREQYFVWDKQASINFIAPGDTDLFAEFEISQGQLDDIYQQTEGGDKCFPEFITHVKNARGDVVAELERTLYVRKKPKYREVPSDKAA
ncbi:DUF4442 domain-containing protein [Vibrio sp. SCSIO 43136]|uniref:DUF4442 domain-containing protein n=1 Tax=Vibrio sp. SCSIO 43136 TaxID=2819101 RepID=UPI002075D79B|nr:DUF4442 domain-containing protein [Vibrio sp. SCSIO 43136]USD64557.1 DUF4442 domain-containing protein [Vibrio sp. SCSIO 43136]